MKRNKSLLVFFISIIILVELSRGQNNRKTEVNVGVVTDVGTVLSDIEMRCINLSLADFYSSRPRFQIRLIPNIADSRNDVVGAAAAALKLIKNKQVPIVSYSATSPSLTSLRSPYFFRATYEDSFQVNAISSIIKLFGWREVVIVYVDNTFGEAIEEAGTNNMTFSNVDLGRNVSELEALGLSQYGPKLIQKLSQVYRILDGRKWSCEETDQEQQSVGALSTWKDHLKHIIWPGEANSVPKGWEVPTNGNGVPKRTGYTDLVEVREDPITNLQVVEGFCIAFFKAVTEEMPYDVSYDFFPFEKSDGTPAGDHNDLKYDAVVGDTTILANRSSYVYFTFPYTKSGVGLIVPVEDQVKRDSISFLKPLTWKLWMTSFFFFLLIGFTVWFVERRINPDFRGPAKSAAATLFCRADAAFLCGECDGKIHSANKLASRHERVWLCQVCEQSPAHVTCKADAAALCVTCDRDIHSANPLSRRHERVPVTPFYDAPSAQGGSSSAAKSASSSANFLNTEDADVSMEAACWLLPNSSVKEGVVEIPNLFTDLDYSAVVDPKMEASENSSGNDGVVPVQTKALFLSEDYFSFDISASKTTFPHGFSCINQTVSSTSLDVPLVPEGGAVAEISRTAATPAVQLSPAEREARVLRYKEKRKNRKFEKTIRYASRKAYAEVRPRIKGRFAKRTDSRVNDGGVYGGFGVVPSF
ncbi:hypothetical protein F2Q68_00027435 [Brassica cretica]|uniref:CCT domain-containing protein n=1 Tax=Brassica cretica TaxID=69181 RepID=A0A8S9IGF8_BRACR|nr:hypothetical protein F2Q68_00027435 [Brassica cretica]